ncbi:MAG: NUDIX domain-containing protein [Frankiaceae bacterium]|jgi:8-oxo-dGTP diphosphatase|nr:NUDIX domain-containing protein [Frankiaceae bacterium]
MSMRLASITARRPSRSPFPEAPGAITPTRTACGALPWRVGIDGALEVLLVHRRGKGDWSIPKGRAEAGELDRDCARREVCEETGLQVQLGPELMRLRYRDRKHRYKSVRYWAAVSDGHFVPNGEVDRARWLSPLDAIRLVTHVRERAVILGLAHLVATRDGVPAVAWRERAVLLVRGAAAIDRADWAGDDDRRALTEAGRRSAASLAALAAVYDIGEVWSAPALRCAQTVRPIARRERLEVRIAEGLAEGHIEDGLAVVDQARGRGAVVCTHEDMVIGILRRLAARDGTLLDPQAGARRGSAWVLAGDARGHRRAMYLQMPHLRW